MVCHALPPQKTENNTWLIKFPVCVVQVVLSWSHRLQTGWESDPTGSRLQTMVLPSFRAWNRVGNCTTHTMRHSWAPFEGYFPMGWEYWHIQKTSNNWKHTFRKGLAPGLISEQYRLKWHDHHCYLAHHSVLLVPYLLLLQVIFLHTLFEGLDGCFGLGVLLVESDPLSI